LPVAFPIRAFVNFRFSNDCVSIDNFFQGHFQLPKNPCNRPRLARRDWI
jgi:hypothetical protein